MQHKHITRRNSGLSWIEIVFILFILLVLVGILLPTFDPPRTPAIRMQNSTQIRGIHSGLVLHAQGNNSYFPGIAADGETVDPLFGLTTQSRVTELIAQNYFTLEYARSPAEEQTGTTSFAMLKINHADDGKTILQGGRNDEWRDTSSGSAIAITDRAVPVGSSYEKIESIHSKRSRDKKDGWSGSVGWNDNSVTWETTSVFKTTYGKVEHAQDNLFTSSDAQHGDDAFMVWHGTDEL